MVTNVNAYVWDFTKRNKDNPKNKVVSANRIGLSLAIRGKGLHFCIMELEIRLNSSYYIWSYTKFVDYLVDYPEVSDNLQDKTKHLLSF